MRASKSPAAATAHRASGCLLAAAALLPGLAAAQSGMADVQPGPWHYGLSIYGYFPTLAGTTSLPTSPGGPSIDVDAAKILDHLKFTFMGTFDAHNGRYGFFTDVIYLDLSGNRQGTRDFTIGQRAIPASASADIGLDFKGLIWTLAGQYRVLAQPGLTVDALAGARMFSMKPTLSWSIAGNIGPIAPAARSGSADDKQTLWDGIVGVKGRYVLGESGKWSVPFYADVGTGQSRLTWQASGGISYAFSWGELTAMWRYLDYEMKSGSVIDNLSFNGPMVGATFRW